MKQLLILATLLLGVACGSAFAERGPCYDGDVEVAVLIDGTGHAQSVTMLQESACLKFNEAAIRAARAQVWTPATRNGRPVPSAKKLRFHFKIADEPTQTGASMQPAP